MNPIESKHKWINATAVALLVTATLFLFTPAQIYFNNTFDLAFEFHEILIYLVGITVTFFLLISMILGLFPQKWSGHSRVTTFFFALGVLLWLQGNIFMWNIGHFDGRAIDWQKMTLQGVIDGAIWVALLALSQWKFRFFYKIARRGSFFLLAMQLLLTAFYWLQMPDLANFKKYTVSDENRFVFSPKRNVIFLLLDNFQSDLFQELINDDPSLKKIFAGFTYYRNNLGAFPVTYGSIPAILTGQYYDNSKPVQSFLDQAYQSSSSIPKTLKQLGFETDFFPGRWWPNTKLTYLDPLIFSNLEKRETLIKKRDIAFLYDLALFRSLPHFLKRSIYNNQHWLLKNLVKDKSQPILPQKINSPEKIIVKEKTPLGEWPLLLPHESRIIPDVNFMVDFNSQAEAISQKNVFKFFHMRGIHDPFRMDENLLPAMFKSNRANWKRIACGELKLADIFLRGLEKLGIFDNSIIFVLADHGHPHGVYGRLLPPDLAIGVSYAVSPDIEKVMQSAIPLLLIKDFQTATKEMKISDIPTSVGDIAATVFERLGIQGNFPGNSIFKIQGNESRVRHFYYYNWNIKSWNIQFMPPLIEYKVNGHAWLTSSWRATGQVLKPPK